MSDRRHEAEVYMLCYGMFAALTIMSLLRAMCVVTLPLPRILVLRCCACLDPYPLPAFYTVLCVKHAGEVRVGA